MKGLPHKIQNINQSKTKHHLHTKRTIHKNISHLRIDKGNISSKPNSTPLIVIHRLWITNGEITELNNIEWNAFEGNDIRSPQGGIEVK